MPCCRVQKKKGADPAQRQAAAAISAAAALAGLCRLRRAGKGAAPPELCLKVGGWRRREGLFLASRQAALACANSMPLEQAKRLTSMLPMASLPPAAPAPSAQVKALADEVAEEAGADPALQRAAADLYAAAAALAPDNTLALQVGASAG